MSIRSDTRESPYKMFTGQEPPWRLDHFCVFGSPAFVLAKKQQDGDTLPKWKARSCSGVYVGHSLVHSGKVPIIYNQRTKHISPQYHVIFDDQFMTVTTNPADMSLTFFDSLYSTAQWLYKDTYTKPNDLYKSFWAAPPPPPPPPPPTPPQQPPQTKQK
jgi:hypothetical protein